MSDLASVKSLVLAGGLGKRLRSLVSDKPKVMAPVAGKPFLEHVLISLKKSGLREIILSVGYMKESVTDYFGDGQQLGVEIDYSIDQQPLGTGGAIKNSEPLINETFIVLNGDTYVDLDYRKLIAFHKEKASQVTIALTTVKDSSRYGTVEMNQEENLVAFKEKSSDSSNKSGLINAGVYVIEPDIFSHLPPEKPISFERDILPDMIKSNIPIYGFENNGYFVDIGVPEDYQSAQKYFEKEFLSNR